MIWRKIFQKVFITLKNGKQYEKHIFQFGICERCGKANSKQVHHKIYINEKNINNPTITLDFNNLELLCDSCHQREHKEKYSPTLWGLEFDSNGDLIKTDAQ